MWDAVQNSLLCGCIAASHKQSQSNVNSFQTVPYAIRRMDYCTTKFTICLSIPLVYQHLHTTSKETFEWTEIRWPQWPPSWTSMDNEAITMLAIQVRLDLHLFFLLHKVLCTITNYHAAVTLVLGKGPLVRIRRGTGLHPDDWDMAQEDLSHLVKNWALTTQSLYWHILPPDCTKLNSQCRKMQINS
jgi:hypothetical protein